MSLKQLKQCSQLSFATILVVGILALASSGCSKNSQPQQSDFQRPITPRGQAKRPQPINPSVTEPNDKPNPRGQARQTQTTEVSTSSLNIQTNLSSHAKHLNDQAVYTIDSYGIQFSYFPTQFVINSGSNDVSEKIIEIWTKEHYQSIGSGSYEGDYPPHVTLSIHPNPQELALQEWIQQNDWLTNVEIIQQQAIAGQTGVSFISRQLYERQYIIFSDPRNSNVVALSVAKTSQGNPDNLVYQEAFETIVSSITFASAMPKDKN